MKLGLGLSLFSNDGAATSVFDPSTLSLTGWWRASFSGAPWAGTASGGGSGSRSLSAGVAAPTAGSALNSLTPADFDGSNQSLSYGAATLDTLLPGTAYTYCVLVKPRSPSAAAAIYNDKQIVGETGAVLGLSWTTDGLRAWHDDGAIQQTAAVACTADSWHWVDVKYDGTNLKLRVDGGSWSSVAAGNGRAFNAVNLRVGRNWSTVYASMVLAELMTFGSAVSDATLAQLRSSYADSRYGLSL